MKIRTLGVVVVGSMSIAAYAAQESAEAARIRKQIFEQRRKAAAEQSSEVSSQTAALVASARGKLDIGLTAAIIDPKKLKNPVATPDDFGYMPSVSTGETLKTVKRHWTQEIGSDPRALAAAMSSGGTETPVQEFKPQTLVVIGEEDEEQQDAGALAVPATKPHEKEKTRMPQAARPAIDATTLVYERPMNAREMAVRAQERAERKVNRDLERTTVVHRKKDIEATTVVNLAGSDDLNVEELLATEVKPQALSEEQRRKLVPLYFVHRNKMENPAWQINPRKS